MAEQSEVRRRAHQVQTSPSYNVWVVVGWRLLIACRQSQRLAIADGSHPTDTVFTLYNRLYNYNRGCTTGCRNTTGCTTGWVNYRYMQMSPAKRRFTRTLMTSLGWRAARWLCGQWMDVTRLVDFFKKVFLFIFTLGSIRSWGMTKIRSITKLQNSTVLYLFIIWIFITFRLAGCIAGRWLRLGLGIFFGWG